MKKFVVGLAAVLATATSALAADMAMKAPPSPAVAPAALDWSGFYIGGNVGYAWSHNDWTIPAPFGGIIGTGDRTGVIGGIQGGYNYQFAPTWLIGIQGDFAWSDITGKAKNAGSPDGRCWSGGDQTADCYATTSSVGTLTGRIGYLANPNVLLYLKGGIAWVRNDNQVDNIIDITGGTCSPVGSRHPDYQTSHTNYATGTGGGGVEVKVTQNVTVFGEYDWIGGRSSSMTMNNNSGDTCVPSFPVTVNTGAINLFKVGANWQLH